MAITDAIGKVLGESAGSFAEKLIKIWKVPADTIFNHSADVENARLEMQSKILDAAMQESQSQAEINKVEAASGSLFVSGWRPAVGWVCVCGLAMQLIVRPFFTWIAALCGHPELVFPSLDTGTMVELLTGMLGLGALRTYEKLNNVASK